MKDYNLFIAIDGIDGSGKSTLAKGVEKSLSQAGKNVLLTREPGGTDAGLLFRQMLISKQYDLEPDTEMMLYCADRLEHQTKLVLPALSAGKDVITDRFVSSTYAYQIFGRGLDRDFLDYLTKRSIKRMPDITFIVEIDPQTALQRAMGRLEAENKVHEEGKFESLGLEFFEKVAEGFDWYAGKFENVWRINGMQPPEKVLADVMHILDNFV